jgi:hypothetical protein
MARSEKNSIIREILFLIPSASIGVYRRLLNALDFEWFRTSSGRR